MTIAGVRSLPQMQSQHAGSAGTVRDRRRRVRLIVATLAVLALATCWIWRLPMLRGHGPQSRRVRRSARRRGSRVSPTGRAVRGRGGTVDPTTRVARRDASRPDFGCRRRYRGAGRPTSPLVRGERGAIVDRGHDRRSFASTAASPASRHGPSPHAGGSSPRRALTFPGGAVVAEPGRHSNCGDRVGEAASRCDSSSVCGISVSHGG
jgi:hypothetical protein